MKAIFYFLAAVCGLFGLLALVRGIEIYFNEGIFEPVQFFVAVIGVLIARLWLKRAKSL